MTVVKVNLKPIVFLIGFFFTIGLLYFSKESYNQLILVYSSITILISMVWLIKAYAKDGAILFVLIFLYTYFLAPLPYFLMEIPIVPYVEYTSIYYYTKTWLLMLSYLLGLCIFTCLLEFKETGELKKYFQPRQDMGLIPMLYWVLVIIFIYLNFRGQAVVNISDNNNFGKYIENLQNQSGALEYFFILYLIGYSISSSKRDKVIGVSVFIYYVYFTFICGFRIQMSQMLLLGITLYFGKYLKLKNVLIISILGFFLLQAHGNIKHGSSSFAKIFALSIGNEVRTNQTEVFYSTNNILMTVIYEEIPLYERINSLLYAFLATVLPPKFSSNWHATISSLNYSNLPAGGGGLMVGHYFYWLSIPGVLLCSYLSVLVFRLYQNTNNTIIYLLSCLLIATCFRWIAYEPIANFFRMGFYFILIYLILINLVKPFKRKNIKYSESYIK